MKMIKERKKQKDKKKKQQPSDSCSPSCSSMDCMGLQQMPSSPPPSYEHSLQEPPGQSSSEHGQSISDEDRCAAGSSGQGCSGSEIECQSNGSPVRQEIFHKSSKEFYKAVAAQWGITCKMSDHCRCLDCQSRYFDCEYDQENEQEKTDGGLGAGTPMFLSEVMHGSACTLL